MACDYFFVIKIPFILCISEPTPSLPKRVAQSTSYTARSWTSYSLLPRQTHEQLCYGFFFNAFPKFDLFSKYSSVLTGPWSSLVIWPFSRIFLLFLSLFWWSKHKSLENIELPRSRRKRSFTQVITHGKKILCQIINLVPVCLATRKRSV